MIRYSKSISLIILLCPFVCLKFCSVLESLDSKKLSLISHRGGAAQYFPENTLSSIQQAKEEGFSRIEIDLQTLKDGTPILFHDSRLPSNRKTCEVTLQELSTEPLYKMFLKKQFALDYQVADLLSYIGDTQIESLKSERIPTFEDALPLLKQFSEFQVDLKSVQCQGNQSDFRFIEILRNNNLLHRAIVESSSLKLLTELRNFEPKLRLLYWNDVALDDPGKLKMAIKDLSLEGVDIEYKSIYKAVPYSFASLGKALLFTFTVNNTEDISRLRDRADFIITDLTPNLVARDPYLYFNARSSILELSPLNQSQQGSAKVKCGERTAISLKQHSNPTFSEELVKVCSYYNNQPY